MKNSRVLTIASLITILLFSFHHADDVVRGMAPGKFSNLLPVFFLVFWLYATTLVFAERQWGYLIILVMSLLALGIPVVHMTGSGFAGGGIANSNGAFFFVWTLVALGATALFCVMLSAQGLLSLRRDKALQVTHQQASRLN